MNIEINPNLDIESLRREFLAQHKIRITDFFTQQIAEGIHDYLSTKVPWHWAHSDQNGQAVRYDDQQLASMSTQEMGQSVDLIHQQASDSYQYSYKFFPIIDAIQANALSQDSVLFQIAAFLNGTEFIRFARQLTDSNTLVKVDPQATLYEPGHFLTTHDDSTGYRSPRDSSERRFAIVLGFTPEWRADWGGQTTFYPNPDSGKSESWEPGFNTLTLFKVPALHAVNYVTPFATKGRYSVTGWLRDDPTIKRPDLGDV